MTLLFKLENLGVSCDLVLDELNTAVASFLGAPVDLLQTIEKSCTQSTTDRRQLSGPSFIGS